MRKWIVLCLAVFLLVRSSRADVVLVRDGAAVSEIVVATNSTQAANLAAEDLRAHLKLIAGADVPIVSQPTSNVNVRVYVGQSVFTDKLGFRPTVFSNSGLEIVARDNYVILDGPVEHWHPSPYTMTVPETRHLNSSTITGEMAPKPEDFPSPGLKAWQDFCGEKFTTAHLNNAPSVFNAELGIYINDDLGPWYAVAELLEQLGVRWYMPYEDGTVLPRLQTIVIPEQHLTREAAFAKREWTYYGSMRTDVDGIKWLKRLKTGNHHIVLYNHTTYAIYSSYEQQLLHPEYLACDSTGKPYEGYPHGRGMPRYTNPGFRRAAVTWMNKVLESQPDLYAITVGPPDGGIKMDARDVDKFGTSEDTIPQKASNYVWDFHVFLANELKKSHPDKFLLFATGAGANLLPTNIDEFPENLLFPPVIRPASLWCLDTYRKPLQAQIAAWRAKMDVEHKAPAWDHWLSYRTPSRPRYPVIFTRALQDQMREILPYVDGKFTEIQPFIKRNEDGTITRRLGVRGLVHLMVYWQNKLFWDPDADRKALLDEYYRLFFGPAEDTMRSFYEFAEEVWTRQESRSLTENTGFLKEEDVDRFFELLQRAHTIVGEGTVYARRIGEIESDMASLKSLFPNLKRTGPWIRAYPAPKTFVLDGDPGEFRYGWHVMGDFATGKKPKKNMTRATVAMTEDRSALLVGVTCYENRMDALKADCRIKDDFSIFQDDVVEVYVNTPRRSYFKIVVNPNGATWDETTDVAIIDRDTLPILWNPGTQAAVRKYDDRWTVEIRIPTTDFGDLGPTKDYPWGIEIGRTRFTGGTPQAWAIAPTEGGPFRTLNRWGNLWMR